MAADGQPYDVAESNHFLAKEFLEQTWNHLCDCREEENVDWRGQPVLNLEQMAGHWKNLGVPDSIGPTPLASEMDEEQITWPEWSSILSGGDTRPNLDIERSQISSTSIDRTWDVDSIFSWASCLSINRGLYVSYHPPISRNISSNVHLSHHDKALHLIPHLRIGSGRQSPQFGVYVFFPGMAHVCRTTSYLTDDERRLWIDRLFLPAIRRSCPPDVLQHHPRSFDDVKSKAHSRRRELCSGIVQSNIDMHHYLPQEYLEAIWRYMTESTEDPGLVKFRGMFIVVSAKNIKLEARSSTFHECRSKITTHLHQVLGWSKADLSRTWIDVGVEDTATHGSSTFLFKSRCLEPWIGSLRHSRQAPLVSSEEFNWNLTGQAGSARAETRKTHPLRRGGIAYAQRYNVNKELFATAAKRDQGLFGEPQLEGLTCPPSLLDAWIVAARQYRSAGVATASKAAPQLKRLRKAFESMKARIRHALDASTQTSFGVREEYRISWKLFMAINPSTAQPSGNHRPYWVLPTAHVNNFMRWEFNRWLSAIDFVRARGSRRDADWEVHQRNMIMATILLRSLKASVNCHHVARRSQMFKGQYVSRQGKRLRGLDFERTMHQTGLAWLPRELFNWSDFHLHDNLVASTTFTFNGLQCVFRNWRDVNLFSRDRMNYLGTFDRMRKMIYRHLALQVIRQTYTAPDTDPESEQHDAECWQGYHGLSHDVLSGLLGEPPCLSRVRKGKHSLGNTYSERVKGLFNWDDGIPRTFWDHCYYRQLCRKFYTSISNHIGVGDAIEWKSSLGTEALRYFWIIPHYDRHSLFTRIPRKADRPAATRPFISGLYQWRTLDTHMNLCREGRWLFGGDMYLRGRPNSLVWQNESGCNDNDDFPEFDASTYEIDFGCSVPFTRIPGVIEAGFKASWRPSAFTDPKILAHYKTAHKCLAQGIGDPLCDLLMMVVLTIASSTVTPALPMHRCDFEDGPRKTPELLAATLTTRMLWFLYPEWFPWEGDRGLVLSVPEMVKKMDYRTERSEQSNSL
ncbi:hypothetical protein EDB81DRAFT_829133 [Dactylonectria macrodidyma]|uniref:Uncharacterized protein n=1 Tax=Dactylonectria macrodidyma TaxID=307937 RepID=A0A9P9I9J7_9HYPO|nr:hypothetical protein EDB81DRAFT_829133 [Dactylonectria macrodidyma]